MKSFPYNDKHPVDAWAAMANGDEPPEPAAHIDKVVKLPAGSPLTIVLPYDGTVYSVLEGAAQLDDGGNWWAGKPPALKKLTAVPGKVVTEWQLTAPCVVYLAETSALYVCHPELVGN